MRNLIESVEPFRFCSEEVLRAFGSYGDESNGMFIMPSPVDRLQMKIIAGSGDGWDHVSVSRSDRCPLWEEMEFVKRKFFKDDETVMQLHVPIDKHINVHNHCLHLWRPTAAPIPVPPQWMV